IRDPRPRRQRQRVPDRAPERPRYFRFRRRLPERGRRARSRPQRAHRDDARCARPLGEDLSDGRAGSGPERMARPGHLDGPARRGPRRGALLAGPSARRGSRGAPRASRHARQAASRGRWRDPAVRLRRPMTTMRIEFRTRPAGEATRAHVMAGLKTVFAAPVVEPAVARATFTDENGPKGGPAIRCALEVKQPRRPVVHVEAVAMTQRLAFDGALAKLERAVARRRETARDAKLRPKKYFAA